MDGKTEKPEDTPRKNVGGRPKLESIQLTKAARQRLDMLGAENADTIFQAILSAALGGDMSAARILADRIWPTRRGCPVTFSPPPIAKPEDVTPAYAWLLTQVAEGRLTAEEGQIIDGMIERRAKAFEMVELAREVEELKTQLVTLLGPRIAA